MNNGNQGPYEHGLQEQQYALFLQQQQRQQQYQLHIQQQQHMMAQQQQQARQVDFYQQQQQALMQQQMRHQAQHPPQQQQAFIQQQPEYIMLQQTQYPAYAAAGRPHMSNMQGQPVPRGLTSAGPVETLPVQSSIPMQQQQQHQQQMRPIKPSAPREKGAAASAFAGRAAAVPLVVSRVNSSKSLQQNGIFPEYQGSKVEKNNDLQANQSADDTTEARVLAIIPPNETITPCVLRVRSSPLSGQADLIQVPQNNQVCAGVNELSRAVTLHHCYTVQHLMARMKAGT